MGNRAVIAGDRGGEPSAKLGIYLHWNGGRDTVGPVLAFARDVEVRWDESGIETIAALFQSIVERGEVLHIHQLDYDNGDNGTYVVDYDLEIVGREFFREEEEEQNFHSYEGVYFAAADSQLGQALVALQDSRLSDSIHIGSNSKVTDYLEKNVRDIVAATLARKAAK